MAKGQKRSGREPKKPKASKLAKAAAKATGGSDFEALRAAKAPAKTPSSTHG